MSISISVADTNRLVEHAKWGCGKILHVAPPYAQIYFIELKNAPDGALKKLPCATAHLKWSHTKNDPRFDGVSLRKTSHKAVGNQKAKLKPKPTHNLQGTIDWFCRSYPQLFDDEKLIDGELDYKRKAHALYKSTLGRGKAEKLLRLQKLTEIAEHFDDVSHATNIPSRFEIMAMHDGLKDLDAVSRLTKSLIQFLAAPEGSTFDALIESFSRLPVRKGGSRVLTWPNLTIFPFLADPKRFIVMKPGASKLIARRMDFELLYSSKPSWHSYASLLALSATLLGHLEPLGAKDYIDVQSFMWVTRELA